MKLKSCCLSLERLLHSKMFIVKTHKMLNSEMFIVKSHKMIVEQCSDEV